MLNMASNTFLSQDATKTGDLLSENRHSESKISELNKFGGRDSYLDYLTSQRNVLSIRMGEESGKNLTDSGKFVALNNSSHQFGTVDNSNAHEIG